MSNEEALQRVLGATDAGVFFDPVDVAHAIVLVCGDEARGITQSDIRLPGNIYKRL